LAPGTPFVLVPPRGFAAVCRVVQANEPDFVTVEPARSAQLQLPRGVNLADLPFFSLSGTRHSTCPIPLESMDVHLMPGRQGSQLVVSLGSFSGGNVLSLMRAGRSPSPIAVSS